MLLTKVSSLLGWRPFLLGWRPSLLGTEYDWPGKTVQIATRSDFHIRFAAPALCAQLTRLATALQVTKSVQPLKAPHMQQLKGRTPCRFMSYW